MIHQSTRTQMPNRGSIARWTTAKMPTQAGRSFVVTGTGGLGLETAVMLAKSGGEVIIAGRNPHKGAEAVARVRDEAPLALVRFESVDLASLASVHDFCERLKARRTSLDVLINNAAVMNPPRREQTVDGLELQFATNYLGHFALTLGLLPLLIKGQDPRVVTLSSIAARAGTIDFDDLQCEDYYKPMTAYGQSKLACLMFALELQRRSDAAGWGISSIAAHPGITRTDLLHNAPGRWSRQGITRSVLWFLFQPVAQGALPTLFAATSPHACGGGYYGPNRLSETRGTPAVAALPKKAADKQAAARLWQVSEQLSGVKTPNLQQAQAL